MSQVSDIEWTDATWNPVRGCVRVSPGCAHCYAETFAERFRGVKGHLYEQGFDLRLVPEKLTEPLRWKKPRRIFVNSMSDLFQDRVSDEYIDRVFAVMALCPQHTFQVLTKRADRMRAYSSDPATPSRIDGVFISGEFDLRGGRACLVQPNVDGGLEGWPLPNVWLGVSCENQHFADERIPLLLQTPAAVRFISAEPLLESVDLTELAITAGVTIDALKNGPHLDWVIVGGESGPSARPMSVRWANAIVEQCRAAGVPVFVKQLGAKPFEPYTDGTLFVNLHLKSKKGGDMAEWPSDLRVREFPQVVV